MPYLFKPLHFSLAFHLQPLENGDSLIPLDYRRLVLAGNLKGLILLFQLTNDSEDTHSVAPNITKRYKHLSSLISLKVL